MCGRFSLGQSAEAIAQVFELPQVPDWSPRYNIAPSQAIPTVSYSSAQDQRQFRLLRWGLIPSWAKDPAIGYKMINARAETVTEKPSFRSAFKQRRCLILADGFYEWQRIKTQKQPYYFQRSDRQPFAFAGLWERWQGEAGLIESCTILTTQANELLQPIHDRMPVMLSPDDYALWLNPTAASEPLLALLHPYTADSMQSHPVSTLVNRPGVDSPECINSL